MEKPKEVDVEPGHPHLVSVTVSTWTLLFFAYSLELIRGNLRCHELSVFLFFSTHPADLTSFEIRCIDPLYQVVPLCPVDPSTACDFFNQVQLESSQGLCSLEDGWQD